MFILRTFVPGSASLCHSLVRQTIMQQVLIIILLALSGLYFLLILYYRRSWRSIPDYKFIHRSFSEGGPQTINHRPQTKISVIIPARNEEDNITRCLDSVCDQSYPKELFEVLVVDDHSTDNTAAIIKTYAEQNVKLISLKEFVTATAINSYKKKAIEIAIQQSTGELIVTTDADCTMNENWLQTIATFYEDKKPAFIVMPVGIRLAANLNTPLGVFLQVFQALDFMTLQGI